ncbi:MAG TPA: serine/threonine-protein kinase [Gemmatimonadales bacterium]|jgi:serine/threonine-protein kinase
MSTQKLATLDPPVSDSHEGLRAALADHYSVERELGRGAMGVVVLAQDVELGRAVAIKVLPPEYGQIPEWRDRFLLETRTTAGFSHPHIVPVFSVEQRGNYLCYVMSYIEGETLTARVSRAGPLPAADAARLMRETAWALGYAHARGVIHRDVKPDNILLERATGRALIADFGIARSSSSPGLTAQGVQLGTPHYMSPEQAAGEPLDGRSDLYSLGAVAFFALTGQPPFDGRNVRELLSKHLTQPAPSVGSLRPDVPAALTAIVDRCLAKERESRYESGEALVKAVDDAGVNRPQVAPAIRAFWAEAETVTVLLPLFVVGVLVAGSANYSKALGLVSGVALMLALRLAFRTRRLGAEGFSFPDLRAGLEGILRERSELAAQGHSRQSRHLKLVVVGCIATAALLLLIAYGLKLSEGAVLALQLVIIMLFFVAVTAVVVDPGHDFAQQRRRVRLWTGPLGKILYRWSNKWNR